MNKVLFKIGLAGLMLILPMSLSARTNVTLDGNARVTWGMTVDSFKLTCDDCKDDVAAVKQLGELEENWMPSSHPKVDPLKKAHEAARIFRGELSRFEPDLSILGIARIMQENIYGSNIQYRAYYFYENKLYKVIEFYGNMDESSGIGLLRRLSSRYGSTYRTIGASQMRNSGDKIEYMWNHSRNLTVSLIEMMTVGIFDDRVGRRVAVVYFDPVAAEEVLKKLEAQKQQIWEQEALAKQEEERERRGAGKTRRAGKAVGKRTANAGGSGKEKAGG